MALTKTRRTWAALLTVVVFLLAAGPGVAAPGDIVFERKDAPVTAPEDGAKEGEEAPEEGAKSEESAPEDGAKKEGEAAPDGEKKEEPKAAATKGEQGPTGAIPPAVFPHWIHRIRYRCYVCHPRPFEMKAGATTVTMDNINKGEQCGMCHGKGAAFGADFQSCQKCHKAPEE